MNLSTLPCRSFRTLWHQGSFNPSDKGVRGPSYEGAGLSVSVDPDAWEQIARLGGLPRWRLTRADDTPGRFVNFHRLSAAQLAALAQAGSSRGWLERAVRHKVSWADPETNDARFCLFADSERAKDEADDMRQWAEEVSTQVTEMDVATALLEGIARQPVSDDLALEMVLTSLVEEVDFLDGVWWADRLDPDALSAPRGCISLRALPRWASVANSQA
jgi:hypothetical protein